jgi:hypothetical protein
MIFLCDIGSGVNMSLRCLLLALSVAGLSGLAGADTRLLMLKEDWCDWCARWEEEVGDAYAKTAEGQRAPLLRADIHEPLPEGVTLARRAHFTPTFVLLEDGREIGRIEGYPGEDFFYGMLGMLLERLDDDNDKGRTDS